MKRSALLIGAQPSNLDAVPGVVADISKWETFLRSLQGGAWEKEEISSLTTPEVSLDRVRKALGDMLNSDYALVAFSGHGFIEDDMLGLPETKLILDEEESISEHDLNPMCSRCVMFLDCCRTEPEEEVMLESMNFGKYASEESKFNRLLYRKTFDLKVMACEKGCTKIYAADLGEQAMDKKSFTRILLGMAGRWRDNGVGSKEPSVLRLNEAMAMTKNYFADKHPQQTPRYQGGRRLHHFPLALNLEGTNA